MPTFIVECYWPGITHPQAKHALCSAAGPENTTATRARTKALGCILVPSDGMAIFLVRKLLTRGALGRRPQDRAPFDRIVESIHVSVNEAEQIASKRD